MNYYAVISRVSKSYGWDALIWDQHTDIILADNPKMASKIVESARKYSGCVVLDNPRLISDNRGMS